MSTRDLVLLSTFVNALILGLLFVLSRGEGKPLPPPKPERVVAKVATPAPAPVVQTAPLPVEQVVAALPKVKEATPVVAEVPIIPLPPQEEWYTVKSGDNPWKIAKTYKIKFEDLLRLNGLNEEKARNLKPGQRIRIR